MKKFMRVLVLVFIANLFLACAPVKWEPPIEEENPKQETLSELIEQNQKAHDSKQKLTQEDLDKMYKSVTQRIPDFDKISKEYKEHFLGELKGFESVLPELAYMVFTGKTPMSKLLLELLPFPLEKLKAKSALGMKIAHANFKKTFSQQLKGVFIWSGALFDVNILKKVMTNLVNKDFNRDRLIMLFMNKSELSEVIYRLEDSLNYSSNPMKFFTKCLVSYLLSSNLIQHSNEKPNYAMRIHASFIANQNLLKMKHDVIAPVSGQSSSAIVLATPHRRISSIFAFVMSQSNLTISEKLRLLSGKGLDRFKEKLNLHDIIDACKKIDKREHYCEGVINYGLERVFNDSTSIEELLLAQNYDVRNRALRVGVTYLFWHLLRNHSGNHLPIPIGYIDITR